jgi:hypothetical protein
MRKCNGNFGFLSFMTPLRQREKVIIRDNLARISRAITGPRFAFKASSAGGE